MGFAKIVAFYGANDEVAHDVTSVIEAKFSSNKISFKVSAAELGLGSLPAKNRQLSVYYQYTSAGPIMSNAACDGYTFELYNSPAVRVIFNRVTYGAANMSVDITKKFQQAMWMNPNNMMFTVGSTKFLDQYIGSDIDLGIHKVLLIDCEWDGEQPQVMVARDGDNVNLNIPPA